MAAAGIKAAPLASLIGRDKDYIRDYLQGRKKSLKADDAQRIASALSIPLTDLTEGQEGEFASSGMEVVGVVAAGRYRDISVEDQDTKKPRIAFAKDLRFPHARQYALEVEGDSMNELFPDGSFVVCVNLYDSGIELKNGMSVHVERSILGGQLVETTLKEVHREGKNRLVLKPRSTNPSHEPMYIEGNEADEISVKGVVIGKWEPVKFGF